jgi:hypothetical protein
MSKHTDYPHFDQGGYSTYDTDSNKTTFFNKDDVEVKDPNKRGNAFLDRFKSNMADYFDDNPNAFDFTGKSDPGDISIGKKSDAFLAQIFPNFVKDYGPQQEPIAIQGTPGQPGLFSQIAGPIAGAAAKSFFACDLNLKHDIDYLTDMNLVRDDLADVAYFVKELQDS